MSSLVLMAVFRGGWQLPLQSIRVFTDAHEPVAELPEPLVRHLISHHLVGIILQDDVREHVRAALPPVRLRAANGRKLRGR